MSIIIKIVSFFFVSLCVAIVGYFAFFGMIIMMNGFSEKDAIWGIYLYIAWAIVVTLLAGLLTIATEILIERKLEWSIYVSPLVAIPVFVVLGVLLDIVGVVIGLFTADMVRRS